MDRAIDRAKPSIAEAEARLHRLDTGIERGNQEEENAKDAGTQPWAGVPLVVLVVETGGHPTSQCGCSGLHTATGKPLAVSWPVVTAGHTHAFTMR